MAVARPDVPADISDNRCVVSVTVAVSFLRVCADRTAVGERGVLDEAYAVLLVHVADPGGLCVGCADVGRFAWARCPVARAALSVVETHGVGVGGWDLPAVFEDGRVRG